MEKNLVKDRLQIIEQLLKQAESDLEKLVLLGMKEALSPLCFLFPSSSIELKGGNGEIESNFFENQKRRWIQTCHKRQVDLHKQKSSDRSSERSEKRLRISSNPKPEFKRSSRRGLQRILLDTKLTPEQEEFMIESQLELLRFSRQNDGFCFFKSFCYSFISLKII